MNRSKSLIALGMIVCLVVSSFAALIAAETAQAQPADSPWPMFGQNAQRTGRSPFVGPDTPHLKWSFNTEHRVNSSPAIGADGTIYVGCFTGLVSSDSYLYAIAPDGSEKWRFTTEIGVVSSPAIGADGTIYVGSGDGNVYAIDPNGTEQWRFATEGNVWSSPAIGADGTIYVGAYESRLYAIHPDGTMKWSFSTEGSVHSSPAIGADGTIYVSAGGEFYAIDPEGTLKWSLSIPSVGSAHSAAVAADGTIYVGTLNNELCAIDSDGNVIWSFDAETSIVGSPAVGVDGIIYMGVGDLHGGADDGAVFALNPDGTERWSLHIGPAVHSSPAVDADGIVYVGSGNPSGDSWARNVYAISPDGTEKWSFATGSYVTSSPAIGADGTIYVGSDKLYAITGIQTECVESATGTGDVCLTTSDGFFADLTPIPALSPAPRGVNFPHGMFEFKITGLADGATVTLTIELPEAVPVGTVWWKHDGTRWYSLPNLDDNGDNIMVIELTDGVLGDTPESPDGEVHDPGGPGNPMSPLTVGWEGSPVNKVAVMAPWITLLTVIAGASLLILRRRQTQS